MGPVFFKRLRNPCFGKLIPDRIKTINKNWVYHHFQLHKNARNCRIPCNFLISHCSTFTPLGNACRAHSYGRIKWRATLWMIWGSEILGDGHSHLPSAGSHFFHCTVGCPEYTKKGSSFTRPSQGIQGKPRCGKSKVIKLTHWDLRCAIFTRVTMAESGRQHCREGNWAAMKVIQVGFGPAFAAQQFGVHSFDPGTTPCWPLHSTAQNGTWIFHGSLIPTHPLAKHQPRCFHWPPGKMFRPIMILVDQIPAWFWSLPSQLFIGSYPRLLDSPAQRCWIMLDHTYSTSLPTPSNINRSSLNPSEQSQSWLHLPKWGSKHKKTYQIISDWPVNATLSCAGTHRCTTPQPSRKIAVGVKILQELVG